MSSKTSKITRNESQNDNSDWGWDNIGADENNSMTPQSEPESNQVLNDNISNSVSKINESVSVKPASIKVKSVKSFDSKQMALKASSDSLKGGMTSSPSFQELERAIGATLAQSMNGSEADMVLLYNRNMTSIPIQRVQNQQRMGKQRNNTYISRTQSSGSNSGVLHVKDELSDFIRESESRALIIFHNVDIPAVIIRDACQKIGALYYIRPEFHQRGVTFLSYSDLRSAVSAVTDLPKELGSISVHYSIMLHGTVNNSEEHRLVVKNLPSTTVETELESLFSRYGEVRSIERKQLNEANETTHVTNESRNAYYVEYFNIQDARSAASELCATCSQIWSPSTTVTFAPMNLNKQNLLRVLLGILSRWRAETSLSPSIHRGSFFPQTVGHNHGNFPTNPAVYFMNNQTDSLYGTVPMLPVYNNVPPLINNSNNHIKYENPSSLSQAHALLHYQSSDHLSITNMGMTNYSNNYNTLQSYNDHNGSSNHMQNSNGLVANNMYRQSINQPDQLILDNNRLGNQLDLNASSYIISSTSAMNSMRISSPINSYNSLSGRNDIRPQHHNNGIQNHSAVLRKNRPSSSTTDVEFLLDLNRLENSSENRTTVMVRNIPNKYTQRMLLDEVDINHKGTYDFFYLPIDFKNRCNVGYCFINFLEPKYIVAFVDEFNGHRWKNFNSEKVCAVTFARIQGKAAMISRFQNSSLLEKHDDYRPLLFYSTGPDRGKPEPFPVSNSRKSQQSKDQVSYNAGGMIRINNATGYQSDGFNCQSSSSDLQDDNDFSKYSADDRDIYIESSN